MSREYKARGKKFTKMTRGGLVERNVATDEEENISKREQDFSLRTEQADGQDMSARTNRAGNTRDQPRQAENKGRRQQQRYQTAEQQTAQSGAENVSTPVNGTTETAKYEPADGLLDENAKTSHPDKPMEAAKPSERSHDARSYENPAGTSPPKPKSTKPPEKPSVLQFKQTEQTTQAAETETTETAAATEGDIKETAHAEKPPVSENVPAKPPPRMKPRSTKLQDKPGKLNFTGEPADNPTGRKSERGNKNERNATKRETAREKQDNSAQSKPDTVIPDKGKPPSREAAETVKKPDKSSKLNFTDEEKPPSGDTPPDKKLSRFQDQADKANSKLEKARDKLPSKKRGKEARIFDEAKGKAKNKFQFETEILPPGTQKPIAPAPVALAKKGADGMTRVGANKLHQKVYEVEHENVGVKAGHRAEQAAESVYRGGKRVTRSAFSYVRNRPYHTVEKLEKKAVKADIRLSYRKAISENPQLKSNVLSRFMQKRKIKKQYAKAAHDAKRAGKAAKKTGDMTVSAAKIVAGVIKRHPVAAIIIILILLLVFFISSLFSSFGSLAGAGLPAFIASSYLAGDSELDTAELSYTEWETDLLMKIGRTEQDYPGYDEYRYQVDNIEHNPYELVAYLTAAYQDFRYADIETVLRQIFNEQYNLSVIESVEIRYADPTDADDDGDYEPYEWRVLTVTLTSRSFTDVVLPRMDAEQISIYSLLLQSKGNRQFIDSPFDFNWLPYVTSYYGYRVHPTTGAKDYHMGIDIGVPTGTEIHAGHDEKVTFAGYNGGYGYVVVIEDDKGLVSKYAHCDTLLVSAGQEVKRGDVIALSGNSGNSTGPHLHLEVIKNGQYLNALYFAVTNDTGLSAPVYGYAGTPMGDGSYAALIEEAEKFLGMPYVWGGSNPSTSFDCSGFVSWVLNQSGVASVGRTTAQGLYNLTTPVSPSDAQPGDLIFFHSTYSSANTVTHVGIYVGNGIMLHCGSPIQYTSINTSYWQSHFYAFGRIN